MTELSAGRPIEKPHHPVGHRSVSLVDSARPDRRLGVEVWYPAVDCAALRTVYEVLPGVAFSAATAQQSAPARSGRFPVVLFSHGRTGMRISYSMVCEALAARGAVVFAPDHPGDALMDWMLGQHTDDRTNEVNRVADAHFLLSALLTGNSPLPTDVNDAMDPDRIVLAGHSYGAFTALATAAGSRGVEAHELVRAVMVFQGYTRMMSDALLGRVRVPALLVVSEQDLVALPAIDADRPWSLLQGTPVWRVDLAGGGHQAISDIALYAELAQHVPDLPDIVRDYLVATAAGSETAAGRGWRELMQLQVRTAWAFLQVALDMDHQAGEAEAVRLAATDGVTVRRR